MIPLPSDFVPRLAELDLARADELLRPVVEAFFVVPALVDFDVALLALDDDFNFAPPFVELALAVPDLLPVLFLADDDLFADELLAAPAVLVFGEDFELDDLDAPDFEPDDLEVDDFEPEAFFVVGIW